MALDEPPFPAGTARQLPGFVGVPQPFRGLRVAVAGGDLVQQAAGEHVDPLAPGRGLGATVREVAHRSGPRRTPASWAGPAGPPAPPGSTPSRLPRPLVARV